MSWIRVLLLVRRALADIQLTCDPVHRPIRLWPRLAIQGASLVVSHQIDEREPLEPSPGLALFDVPPLSPELARASQGHGEVAAFGQFSHLRP